MITRHRTPDIVIWRVRNHLDLGATAESTAKRCAVSIETVYDIMNGSLRPKRGVDDWFAGEVDDIPSGLLFRESDPYRCGCCGAKITTRPCVFCSTRKGK